MNYKHLLYMLMLILSSRGVSFSQTHQTYKSLADNWYYYDEYQRHQDYQSSKKSEKLFLTLDKSSPAGARLNLSVNEKTGVFIGEVIIEQLSKTEFVNYDIDSLFELYESSDNFITILLHNREGVVLRSTSITVPVSSSVDTFIAPELRNSSRFENVLLILMFLILAMFVYIKISHTDIWKGYMNWTSLLFLKDSGEAIYKIRPFEKGTLLIVLTYSMSSATVIFGLSYLSGFTFMPVEFHQGNSIVIHILQWTALVFTLFVFAYLKYFLIKTFTRLFEFKGASRVHFYNHIKLLIVINIFMLLTMVILIFGLHWLLFSFWLKVVVISFLFLKTLLVSMKLFKISRFRFFHLFSYLCATEIIPAIILVKITFII